MLAAAIARELGAGAGANRRGVGCSFAGLPRLLQLPLHELARAADLGRLCAGRHPHHQARRTTALAVSVCWPASGMSEQAHMLVFGSVWYLAFAAHPDRKLMFNRWFVLRGEPSSSSCRI